MSPVTVAVLTTDPIVGEGARAALSAYPQLTLVDAARTELAGVIVVLVRAVTDDVLVAMEHMSRRRGGPAPARVVVVTDSFAEHQLARAVGAGLVCLLDRRCCGFDRVVTEVVAAGTGRVRAPAAVPRALARGARPPGLDASLGDESIPAGFAARELDVLRLLSNGSAIGQIAVTLNYSERTVKNIIRGVLTRYNLRNRTHAVAYAMRRGVL